MASSSQLSFDDDPDIYSLPAVHGDDGSSESTSSSDDDKVPEKKARGKNREFVLHREFNSKQAYDAWWQEERSNWRAGEAYGTSSADVENFRCKYSRRVNYNCKATLRVSYVATSEKVAVYLSADGHDHNLDQPHPLSEENKKRIKELSATGLPPKRILSVLQESDTVPCPSLKQIQNLTKRANATKSNKLTDWELKTYCDAHSAQPVEEDACYVIGYAVKSSKQFFVIWSTRRLIERQSNQLLLQCDSTCSTNWYNFPLQVMGYSDLDRHFVPTLIAVSSSEDTYAYQSIFSTIKALGVLPSAVLADVRNCDKRLKSSGLSKDLRQSIRADIEKVQYARSHGEFNRVVELMLNSWPDAAAEFAAYFRKQ
ncbi:hypothetical protein AAVH_25940 [Aphelenchoides avenae]|nr:hypothetical protein AAVH_25940 [Aphelenchus avenae]